MLKHSRSNISPLRRVRGREGRRIKAHSAESLRSFSRLGLIKDPSWWEASGCIVNILHRKFAAPEGSRHKCKTHQLHYVDLSRFLGTPVNSLAQGISGVSSCPVCSCAHFLVHHCTRDRGCSAHPAFPAPSLWRAGSSGKARTQCVARRRSPNPVVPDKRSAISDAQLRIGGPIRRGPHC